MGAGRQQQRSEHGKAARSWRRGSTPHVFGTPFTQSSKNLMAEDILDQKTAPVLKQGHPVPERRRGESRSSSFNHLFVPTPRQSSARSTLVSARSCPVADRQQLRAELGETARSWRGSMLSLKGPTPVANGMFRSTFFPTPFTQSSKNLMAEDVLDQKIAPALKGGVLPQDELTKKMPACAFGREKLRSEKGRAARSWRRGSTFSACSTQVTPRVVGTPSKRRRSSRKRRAHGKRVGTSVPQKTGRSDSSRYGSIPFAAANVRTRRNKSVPKNK